MHYLIASEHWLPFKPGDAAGTLRGSRGRVRLVNQEHGTNLAAER